MLKKILFLISALLGTAHVMHAAGSSSAAPLTALEKKAAARMINDRLEYKGFTYNARCANHSDIARLRCADCEDIKQKVATLRDLAAKCTKQWNPQPLTPEEVSTLRSVLDNTEEITRLESGKSQIPRTIGCHEFDMMRAELPLVDSYDQCSHNTTANLCQTDACFEAQVYKRHEAIKKNISALLRTPGAQKLDTTEQQILSGMTDWRGEPVDRFMVKPERLLQIQALCERLVQQYPNDLEARYEYTIPYYRINSRGYLTENIEQNIDALNNAIMVEYQTYLESLGKTFSDHEKRPLCPQQQYIVDAIIAANDPTIKVAQSPENVALDRLWDFIPKNFQCMHAYNQCTESCIAKQIAIRREALRKESEFWHGHSQEKLTAEEEQLIADMLSENDQILIRAHEIEMITNTHDIFINALENSCAYFNICYEQNCSAQAIHQRITTLKKKRAYLFHEDGAEALTPAEEALVQQAIQETQEIASLKSLRDKLWYDADECHNKAVEKALKIKHKELAQKLVARRDGDDQEAIEPLTHEEMELIADAQKRFEPEIDLDQNNPDQQPSQKNGKQPQKTNRIRGIIPAIGAVITVVAGTKAYNIAHKEIVAEFNAAQKKAEKEGQPLAPEMTKWQLRKAAVKRTGHNICTKLFKKHKLFATGLILLIGGTLYDFGPNLFE